MRTSRLRPRPDPDARWARTTAVATAGARVRWRCQAKDLVPDVGCSGVVDGHEPLPRSRGGDPTDPDDVMVVCRAHHDWIHGHPARSRDLGLTVRGFRSRKVPGHQLHPGEGA